MTGEPSALIGIEREELNSMFLLMALTRETAAEAKTDARYIAAADSLKRIAATMDKVDDDVLARMVSVNTLSSGLLGALLMARLEQVGFALPCCADAPEFFQPLDDLVSDLLRKARSHMH